MTKACHATRHCLRDLAILADVWVFIENATHIWWQLQIPSVRSLNYRTTTGGLQVSSNVTSPLCAEWQNPISNRTNRTVCVPERRKCAAAECWRSSRAAPHVLNYSHPRWQEIHAMKKRQLLCQFITWANSITFRSLFIRSISEHLCTTYTSSFMDRFNASIQWV